jgi:hypothetical protein
MEMWINTDIFYSISGFKNNHFNLKTLITTYHKLPPTKNNYKGARNRYHVHNFTSNNTCIFGVCMCILKKNTISIAVLRSFGRTFKININKLQGQVQY